MFGPRSRKPATPPVATAQDASSRKSFFDNPSTPLFPGSDAHGHARELVNEPGEALDDRTRQFFESRLGHDFSSVRVHTDEQAANAAAALSAQAFTLGSHIAFRRGEFAPHTARGRELLGHELAHVVQQSRGGSAAPGPENRGLESAADDAARKAARGARTRVEGSSAIGIACKSMFEEFTDGKYAPGLLLNALQYGRPAWKIAEDVDSLGAADRAQALKDIESERARRKARLDFLVARRAALADPGLHAVIDPELAQVQGVLAKIDTVRGRLALRRPIPGWNFTPGDFANLQRAKKTLTFAPDSGWFPANLQENLRKTLEFVLDRARSPAATEGVNAVDFFHGHLVVSKDPATAARAKKASDEGLEAEAALARARERRFGKIRFDKPNPISTPGAIADYKKIVEGAAPAFTKVLDDAGKLPGAAVMYHTFEFNDPSDVKAQGRTKDSKDPRRHYVTPLDTNSPRQYTPPADGSYEKEFTHVIRFVFQIDDQGLIHVRPFETSASLTTLEISTITGQSYPDVVDFEK